MRLWIDTEYNGFEGVLISMALVDETGRHWYEVLKCADPCPWVASNVMPVLDKRSVSKKQMQQSLSKWLDAYDHIHVVADWPEDIAHFCRLLATRPGYVLRTPRFSMEVRYDLETDSEVPHNALADACALRAAHLLAN